MHHYRKICVAIYLFLPLGLMLFLMSQNLPLNGQLNSERTFDRQQPSLISYPYPENRLGRVAKEGKEYYLPLISEIAYFDLAKPAASFDEINLSLAYQRPADVAEIRLGLPRGPEQFQEFLLSQSYLDQISWKATAGDDYLTLWQKNVDQPVGHLDDFLDNPPADKIIAIHQTAPTPQIRLSEYQPTKQEVVIPLAFEGRFSLVTYIENEPLQLSFEKTSTSDNKETVKIFDYLNREISSHELDASARQEISSPRLAPGRYKVDFNLAPKTQIKGLRANSHYLMVKDQLTLADFPDGTSKASLTINTKRLILAPASAASYQKISLGDQTYRLQSPSEDLSLELPATVFDKPVALNLERGGVSLSFPGGYLAFSKSTVLFDPAPKKTFSFTYQTTDEELSRADYILARYLPPEKTEAGLSANRLTVPVTSLYLDPATKSWPFALLTPGLEQNCSQVWLKKIEASLIRPPLRFEDLFSLLKKVTN